MFLLIATLAAAEPPSRELLDDIERWEAGQDALLEGPPGCWDLEARLEQVVTLHQPPDFFSAARHQAFPMVGTVKGRLVDGVWQGELVQEVKPDGHDLDVQIDVYPLFGNRKVDAKQSDAQEFTISVGEGGATQIGGSIGSSVNLLREAVDKWSGSVETSLAQWDAEQNAVLYLRELPLSDSDDRRITVTVRFPEADATADRIDAVWPKLVKLGEWPFKVKIRDAQMHAVGHRVGDQTYPWVESLSFVAGAIGYTVGFEQTITWRKAIPCVAAPAGSG